MIQTEYRLVPENSVHLFFEDGLDSKTNRKVYRVCDLKNFDKVKQKRQQTEITYHVDPCINTEHKAFLYSVGSLNLIMNFRTQDIYLKKPTSMSQCTKKDEIIFKDSKWIYLSEIRNKISV